MAYLMEDAYNMVTYTLFGPEIGELTAVQHAIAVFVHGLEELGQLASAQEIARNLG